MLRVLRKIFILIGFTLFMLGCSEDKKTSTLPTSHPDSWIDNQSIDFHGAVVLDRGAESCGLCHGVDYDGGDSEVSCIECHQTEGVCVSCHGGTDNLTGAPPLGLEGETATSDLAVGAHTAHLNPSISDPIKCQSCHVVPVSILDSQHLDLLADSTDSIAELTFSEFPNYTDVVWDRESATCAELYCHGNFSGGNSNNLPVWNASNQATCGSCHDVGATPETLGWKHEFHVETADLDCSKCHGNVVDSTLQITNLSLHLNGLIDTLVIDTALCNSCHGSSGGGCTLCHGGTDNQSGAPPVGLNNEIETSDLSVGAHTIHLAGGSLADGFVCESCHIVPEFFSDAGHLGTDTIAELNWGGISGSESEWNRNSAECNNTYCHGNFSGGNIANAPVWTNGSTETTCGSCHDVGIDPASLGWKHQFHIGTANIDCEKCHGNVVDNSLQIIDISLHVNGLIDTLVTDTTLCNSCHSSGSGGCTLCHGGTDNQTGAPPFGIERETVTTELAVGAHTIHLEGGNNADGFNCESCHLVPTSFNDPGHYDADSVAELTWGGLSGVSSDWNRVSAECSNTYCHGNFTGGDNTNAPVWTNGSTDASCGSCHDVGTNPASLGWNHDIHVRVFNVECQDCHSQVVDGALQIISRSLHVNGLVDTLTFDTTTCGLCHSDNQPACYGCHGGIDNLTGAPPRGIRDEMLTTDLAVGAHTAHVDGSTISDGVDCTECHVVPNYFGDPGHYDIDSVAELTWGPLAGVSSTWDRSQRRCANTYCHGNFSGGFNDSPNWTSANQASCGSCHDVYGELNSLSGEHKKHVVDKNIECAICHSTVVNSSRNIIGLDLHINGINEINITVGNNATYNGNSCTGTGCHGQETW